MPEPRAVSQAKNRLRGILRSVRVLGLELADLHALAYERQVGGDLERGVTPTGYALDAVGRAEARRVWNALEDELRRVDITLDTLRADLGNLFTGPGPDTELRGTLISRAEFERQKRAAARRKLRGEEAPRRTERQPNYPKRGSR